MTVKNKPVPNIPKRYLKGYPPKKTRIITIGQEYVFQGQTVNVKEISESPEA